MRFPVPDRRFPYLRNCGSAAPEYSLKAYNHPPGYSSFYSRVSEIENDPLDTLGSSLTESGVPERVSTVSNEKPDTLEQEVRVL